MVNGIQTNKAVAVSVGSGAELPELLDRLAAWQAEVCPGPLPLGRDPRWLCVFQRAMRHVPYCLHAESAGQTAGFLPLALVESLLFGRFLVSVPYLNSGGVVTADEAADNSAAELLIDRAAALADQLDVRYLELRHEQPRQHARLNHELTSKVHMRLPLPDEAESLWKQLDPKVRNQVRKGEKEGLTMHWGGHDLVGDFYAVFSHNMRDLGTPVFGRELFTAILDQFPDQAELCVVRQRGRAIAGGLLLHGRGVTEVPSAASLRRYNPTNANMLMYWHLLCRAIERGQQSFDFGRSSRESGTYRFKKQWGAQAEPAHWQYYVRKGSIEAMRPEGGRNQRLIRIWRRLPVGLTRLLGPRIVRGIP